ncbi:uncharacterized protein LOC133352542 [Lethenteron reissneri]|uniref:uncharacterized protein LOC133352542 n=1 Tax=Lethenteron reissneri TaxID=7753 RepID=UPI002AB65946|nr:uncharacterized protein LOC133352542 [Lethenteron reissneri]
MARCLENSRSDASPRADRFWVGSPKTLSPVVEILEQEDLAADHSVATRAHVHTTGALKGAPVVKGGVRLARGGSLQSPPPLERAKEAPLEEDGFGRRVVRPFKFQGICDVVDGDGDDDDDDGRSGDEEDGVNVRGNDVDGGDGDDIDFADKNRNVAEFERNRNGEGGDDGGGGNHGGVGDDELRDNSVHSGECGNGNNDPDVFFNDDFSVSSVETRNSPPADAPPRAFSKAPAAEFTSGHGSTIASRSSATRPSGMEEETKATADLGHVTWESRGDFKGRARGPVTQELSPPSRSGRQAARNREGAEVYWSSSPRRSRGAARRRRKKSVGAGAPVDDRWTQWVCMQIEAAVEHELVEEGGHVPDPIFML